MILQKIIINENSTIFIKPVNDDYDLSIWTSLQKYNSSKEMIYIVLNDEPLEGIRNYVNNMFQKYKSGKLRYIYWIKYKYNKRNNTIFLSTGSYLFLIQKHQNLNSISHFIWINYLLDF